MSNDKEIAVGEVIRDLEGEPIKIGDAQSNAIELTLGHMIIQITLQGPREGQKPYTVEQQRARYKIASDVRKAMDSDGKTISLPIELIDELADKIAMFYAPGVAGPALEILL